jgi:hypothetical protein
MAFLPHHNATERLVRARVPSLEPFPNTATPCGGNGHTKVLKETLTLRPKASSACLSGIFVPTGYDEPLVESINRTLKVSI